MYLKYKKNAKMLRGRKNVSDNDFPHYVQERSNVKIGREKSDESRKFLSSVKMLTDNILQLKNK